MAKARRAADARVLQDIPNIGPSMAGDLRALGINTPAELVGQDPYAMYERMMVVSGVYQDPCVCDTFIAAVRFMEGAPPHPWWFYTDERKRAFDRRR
jgi:Pathogenicity locus